MWKVKFLLYLCTWLDITGEEREEKIFIRFIDLEFYGEDCMKILKS